MLPPPLSIARVRGVWCLRGAVSTSGETVRELALVRGAVVAGACCVLPAARARARTGVREFACCVLLIPF